MKCIILACPEISFNNLWSAPVSLEILLGKPLQLAKITGKTTFRISISVAAKKKATDHRNMTHSYTAVRYLSSSDCVRLSHISKSQVTHPDKDPGVNLSRSLSNPFEPRHKRSSGAREKRGWRSNAGRIHLGPSEVTLHGRGPLRRTRAFPLCLIRPLLSRLRGSVISPSVPARFWPRPETGPPFFAPSLLTEGPWRSPLQPPAQRRSYWEAAEKAFHRSITEQRRALISLRLRPPGTRLVRLRSPPGGERFLLRLQKGLCKRAKSTQHNSMGKGF